ncbi:coq1 putative hexaprenyl diphosphate synthase [Savitreella phatthalungensis]
MRISRSCCFRKAFSPRFSSSFSAAVSHAARLVEHEAPSINDPLSLVRDEMGLLTKGIHSLLGSKDVNLDSIAKYYVRDDGAKRLRPLMVLLISKALARTQQPGETGLENTAITPNDVLNDSNPSAPAASRATTRLNGISASQNRLAEITEMIHAASLLHDDVIDDSPTRRSAASAHIAFSPKMAILCGDFMLGRASVALARLRHPEVVELLATVIANLVEGEFMQLRNEIEHGFEHTMEYYLQKTYLKTASLMAKSCRAAAILGSATAEQIDAAYLFGKNLGLGFQIVDDMLDYTAGNGDQLGKPAGADLKLGLATAPVLFAWQEHRELGPLIARKFSKPGDVELARDLSVRSNGVAKTQELASGFTLQAISQLRRLPESAARDALESIAQKLLTRTR